MMLLLNLNAFINLFNLLSSNFPFSNKYKLTACLNNKLSYNICCNGIIFINKINKNLLSINNFINKILIYN